MTLNPFEEQLENAEARILDLKSSLKIISDEIDWYENTDLKGLTKGKHDLQGEFEAQSLKCTQLLRSVQQIKDNINNQSIFINSLWNPKNWFDSKQRELRYHLTVTKMSLKLVKGKALKAQAQLQYLEQHVCTMAEKIERYKNFDFDAKSASRTVLANQLAKQKIKAEQIASRKQQIDAALEPIVKQIREAEQKKSEAISVKHQAQMLEQELSNAGNSYERAMVHEKCEERFGTGNPKRIISRNDSEVRRIDRDLDKLQKRAKFVADKAARDIIKLILDGNNLCYQGDSFLGLEALKHLVPILAEDYEVIVVFDASIRRALGSADSDVRDVLGGNIHVHIVATSVKADETVIDLAGSDKTTYIVSNDRFAEFGEKPAIHDQRVIRHEIVSGQVLIHDLGISEIFKA